MCGEVFNPIVCDEVFNPTVCDEVFNPIACGEVFNPIVCGEVFNTIVCGEVPQSLFIKNKTCNDSTRASETSILIVKFSDNISFSVIIQTQNI